MGTVFSWDNIVRNKEMNMTTVAQLESFFSSEYLRVVNLFYFVSLSWYQQNAFKPTGGFTCSCCLVVLFLLIYCLLLLPLLCEFCVLSLILCVSSFAIIVMGERELIAFTLIVFLML